MTDYTHILPADDRDLQILLSSCRGGSQTPREVAYLEIDLTSEDGEVALDGRTEHGGDAIPIEVHNGHVHWYDLAPRTDATWLRDQLANGEVAGLLDRIIAGHSIVWNGNNNVGRLDEDASEAADRLTWALEGAPTSDLSVVDAREWLQADQSVRELARTIRRLGDTPETLLAAAESDPTVVIEGGIDAMEGAVQDVLDEADIEEAQELLDGWDEDEVEEADVIRLYKAVFSRAPGAGEDMGKAILGAINTLDAFAARRVIEVLGGEVK